MNLYNVTIPYSWV